MNTSRIYCLHTIGAVLLFLLVLVTSCKEKTASDKQDSVAVQVSQKPSAPQIDIHTAIVTNNMEALKQHLAAGTDVNEKDAYGGSSPLISASLFDRPEMVKLLISSGADINFQNNEGSTALHVASFFCRPAIVKMLLEKKADKTVRNKYGATAYESVAGSFKDIKPTYEMMDKMFTPMGLKLDLNYIEKTRPEIAAALK